MEEVATASVESSESAESIPETSTTETATTETATTETAPDFNFGEWDGNRESLPTDYHSIYSNINDRLESSSNDMRSALQRDREIYQALLDGEDVNGNTQKELADVLKELEELKTNSSSWAEEKTGFESQLEDLNSRIQEHQTTEQEALDSWAQGFRDHYQELLANDQTRDNFVQLLDSGIDPDISIELVQMDPDVSKQALNYMQNGVPGTHAIKLAKLEAKKTQIVEPRPAAELTAGATAATVPNSSRKSLTSNSFSMRDARRLAATRAYKKRIG